MKVFNPKKDNGLEYNYEMLFIQWEAYNYGGMSDALYARIKKGLLSDKSWKKLFDKLTKRKFRKYNLSALLALIRLLDVGAISKEEYDNERKKIFIEYKEKSADYYDL